MEQSVEEALDDCLKRVEQDGLEACLRRYPEYRAELEPLLRLALALNHTVAVGKPRRMPARPAAHVCSAP